MTPPPEFPTASQPGADQLSGFFVEGPATVTTDPERCRDAERRYAERYREPKQRPDRAVIEIAVDRILGRAGSPGGG